MKLSDHFESISVNHTDPVFGINMGTRRLWVHKADNCEGRNCVIHNPSDHHMKEWPLSWRGDRGMMERIDPKTGNGHPDPDDVAYHMSKYPEDTDYAVHGCDGACHG